MNHFESASILLPVINETSSLIKTVDVIEETCGKDVREFIFIVCGKTLRPSLQISNDYKKRDPTRFIVHHQELPFLGGAIREGFERASGSHVIMMASDLETDPYTVKDLISETKKEPDSIITTSRWSQGARFQGYNRVKLILNLVFQRIFALLYGTTLTDMTFGYRIFPTKLVNAIRWEELRHPFLFETIIKPLRLGINVREIPSPWKARVEGESQNTFLRNFEYFRIGLRVRFYPPQKIVRHS